jgi:N-methylhydantoinase A/oxoprolinase/acetone carboxylase beta subunit
MRDTTYLIGVDTGGTYTDAAVIDADGHAVLATAKAITTRGDLAVGVVEAIQAATARLGGGFEPGRVALVAVSTTLATNAVVEGHGGPAAVLLVGFDAAMAARTGIAAAFPGMPVERIDGGHDHSGAEKAPLDEEAVIAAIDRHGPKVEAFAVAGAFAVRNAAHERRVRDLIVARTGKPVTLSTELASALDAPRRALTAALNARLISRVTRLVDAVGRAMDAAAIRAPLMIVKGDGTLALGSAVATRPIETVLSGPAASLVGARWLSSLDSFILSDMGGTTTDLAVFENGLARVTDDGADLGGWRTMVRAVDVRTVGLGGDSEIAFGSRGEIVVGPGRVLPVSLLGARFPEVDAALDHALAHPTVSAAAFRFALRPLGWTPREGTAGGLTPREADLMARIGERPVPLSRLVTGPSTQRALDALRARGLVQVSGPTPSDAAHVLGLQETWSRGSAERALALAVRLRDMAAPTAERIEALARAIWSETARLSAREVLSTALGHVGTGPLSEAVCRGEAAVGLARVRIAPAVPVVAVGGPVRVFYGEVGRRLDAEVVFPPHWDVANAVGAATALVSRTVAIEVTGDGSGIFRVHAPDAVLSTEDPSAALAMAREAAEAAARTEALALGATDPSLSVDVVRRLLPGTTGDSGLYSATVTAVATGHPDVEGLREVPR